MHPVWQIKQIVTINGQSYVDRNLSFGSSSLPGIFILFNSLVAWIVKNVKNISFILDYVDDSSGCNLQGDTAFYPPYARELPIDQCHLLLLWDVVLPKSGSVWFFEDFFEPGTGPMVQSRQMSEPWTGP